MMQQIKVDSLFNEKVTYIDKIGEGQSFRMLTSINKYFLGEGNFKFHTF